jgi:hypothetical protein
MADVITSEAGATLAPLNVCVVISDKEDWSTLTFQRCSSRHITQVTVALYSDGVVAPQVILTLLSAAIVAQQRVPTKRPRITLVQERPKTQHLPGSH